MRKIQYITVTIFVVLFVLSCSTKKEVLYVQDIDTINNQNISFLNPTIQTNDILKITIGALIPETAIPYNKSASGVQNNNIELMKLEGYVVDSNSKIKMPILGEISVKDKTTQELSVEIKNILEDGKHLLNPSVNVRILNAKVTILGEVNRPGTFNFTEERLTFLQALGLAGDLTIEGKRNDVLLIREVNDKRQVTHIDLTKSDWINTDAYYIKPNDVIVVDPNIKKVKSSGIIGNTSTLLGVASLVISITILLTR